MLVRTGFVVVLALVNVSGFRPVLARGWHEGLPETERARVEPLPFRGSSTLQATDGSRTRTSPLRQGRSIP